MASFFDDPETKVDDYWAAQNEAQKGVQVTEVSPPVAASGQAVQPTPASNPNVIANRTPAVTQNKQSYQIMEDIYSLPKPEYDATKASEIKRLAKINALSQGFNVLGDVISLGLGANVNKRQPDTLPQQLWQYKQHYDDTYQQRLDQWRTQQAVQRIRGLERQEQLDYQRQRDEEARKFRQQQLDADKQYKQWLIDEKLADNKANQDRWEKEFKYRESQDKKQLSLNYAQLERQKQADLMRTVSKAAASDKGMVLYDDSRNPLYTLNESESSKLIEIILKDPITAELAKNDLSLMQAQFGSGMTAKQTKNIIAYYWDKSPDAIKFLGQPEQKEPIVINVEKGKPGYTIQMPQNQNTTKNQPSLLTNPQSNSGQPTLLK